MTQVIEDSAVVLIKLKEHLESKNVNDKVFEDILEFLKTNGVALVEKKKSSTTVSKVVKVLAHKGFASKSAEELATTNGYSYESIVSRLAEIPTKDGKERKKYQTTGQVKISIQDVRDLISLDKNEPIASRTRSRVG